jgi:hypothetical protein
MSFLIILGVITVVLFAAAFFTRRRIGVLGLALAAGGMVSTMWVGDLTPYIERAGVVIIQPPLESLVASTLVLLPAVLLLFSGPVYKSSVQRIGGAVIFALLAVALLLPSIGAAFVIDATGRPVYEFLAQYRTVIVTIGLAASVVDIILLKMPKHSRH